MAGDDDLQKWLEAQPLEEPVDIDGESVYLQTYPGGAELGAYLGYTYTQHQLHDALRQGFQSALHFDAGLGLSPDGKSLVLSRWLPDAVGWPDAAEALEQLLNQLAIWREALAAPARQKSAENPGDRNEQRLRMLFSGAKK